MPSERRAWPQLAALSAGALAAAWTAATFIFLPHVPGYEIASFAGLALALLGLGRLFSMRFSLPIRRARELLRGLSGSGIYERVYVKDAEAESGKLMLEINSFMDRTEEANVRQRQFVSAVSHDIRTPLTIMKGDIEVALMKRRTIEDYEEILRSNQEEIDRVHRLVEDLITVARADYGEMGLNLRTVELGTLLAQVREDFVEAARKKGLILEGYLEGETLIEGDAARLRQLFHNLIDNAVHYTATGGRIEFSLVTLRDQDQVQVRVRDTGIGISTQDLPHIFEPFYRGTHSRRTRHDGYGLGLAICDHIVRAHGGRISVESREGQAGGTTFTVHLPKKSRPG